MPAEYVAESVVAALRRRVKGKRVLLVRARVARDVLPKALRRAGARVEVAEAYQTVVPPRSRRLLRKALHGRRPDWVTFTSSSTVHNFVEIVGQKEYKSLLEGVAVACIGPVTAKTAEGYGMTTDIMPKEYTIPAFVDAIVEYFTKKRLVPTKTPNHEENP